MKMAIWKGEASGETPGPLLAISTDSNQKGIDEAGGDNERTTDIVVEAERFPQQQGRKEGGPNGFGR